MQTVPLQPVPSQQISTVLGGQNCQLSIYAQTTGIYADITVNGVVISTGIIALNFVPLNPFNYAPFVGNLIFFDTQGVDDPTYTGLGSRFQLAYLTEDEYAEF